MTLFSRGWSLCLSGEVCGDHNEVKEFSATLPVQVEDGWVDNVLKGQLQALALPHPLTSGMMTRTVGRAQHEKTGDDAPAAEFFRHPELMENETFW